MHLLCLSGLDSPTLSFGTKQTLRSRQSMSALGDVAEVAQTTRRAHGGKFTGGSRRSISCRRGSSHAGSFSAVPSVSGRSSRCHSDYGHAQIDVTAPSCGDSPVYIVRQMKPRDLGAVARASSASGPVLSAAGY